ncbi:MAG: DUF4349 domain-containing protein [Candidatus Aquilonibacter sp.]
MPLVLVSAAIVLVAASLAASHIAPGVQNVAGEVEKVSISRSIMAARQLKVNVPETANASSSARAQAASRAAPQIARVANLTIYVGDVDAALAKIGALAQKEGGDVFSLDVSGGTGNVEVRIPAVRFDATMNALARLGTVRERTVNAQDLGADITDSAAKLRNLRRTEGDILRIMDRSGTVGQILDAENQLSSVREQIETLEADLTSMRGRVTYSTITTELDAEPVSAPVRPRALDQLANAWRDDVASLGQFTIGMVAMLMWLVVFMPYALVPAIVVWVLLARRKHAVRG